MRNHNFRKKIEKSDIENLEIEIKKITFKIKIFGIEISENKNFIRISTPSGGVCVISAFQNMFVFSSPFIDQGQAHLKFTHSVRFTEQISFQSFNQTDNR